MRNPKFRESFTHRPLWFLAALLIVSVNSSAWSSEPYIPPGFAPGFVDHMVLQRDRELRVWGQAPAQTVVTVRLANAEQTASADASGRWQAIFPPMPAGGPYTLELSGPAGTVQTVSDILFGEVWLCSGQSNMAYRMAQMNDHARETTAPPDSIRLLTIERDHSVVPQDIFSTSPQWQVADPVSVQPFSAACFLFAQELQKDLDVPFGLVNSSWGGSAIESWISADGLREAGGFDRNLDLNKLYGTNPRQALASFVSDWQDWWRQTGGDNPPPWADAYDDHDWALAPPGLGNWQQWENAGLENFTGMLWYRKSFRLTPEQAAGNAVLDLGGVDELDVTWVNGKAVGTRFGWGDPRQYTLEPGLLRPGDNVLSINVYNSWSAGGLNGPPAAIRLTLADGSQVPLGESWRYQAVASELGSPPKAPWESITGLTGLYNAMIAPLREFELGGVLWYQGESNAGRPPSYQKLLGAMVDDWRKSLGGDLPFIIVQLPNFGSLPNGPSGSAWAQLRHDQQQVALADSQAGLVVTLDSADRSDLHPPNKRIVGERAAAVARGLLLGAEEVVDGIVPIAARRDDKQVIVRFGEAGMPLRVAGSGAPAGFELCSAETVCRYTDARLEGNRVVLDAAGFENATEVRYAWADAPLVNLFGTGDLPVGSFRLTIE